jgi:hypothetical protein
VVGEEEVTQSSEINGLLQGAGILASLASNGYFERPPHLLQLYFLTAIGSLAPIAFGAALVARSLDKDKGTVTAFLGAAFVFLVVYFGLGWLYEHLSLTQPGDIS